MGNPIRCYPFWLLALLLGLTTSAQAHDTNTLPSNAVPTKDEALAQELQQAFGSHLDLRNVTVDVDDRVAVLKGMVGTYREKLDAEDLARRPHGIDGIRDYIAVKPAVPISDKELQDNIANRLLYDRIDYGMMFNNFQISVKNGVVTIAGAARSYPDKACALAIVDGTPGVRDVKDDISVLPLSQFDDDVRIRTAMAIYSDPALHKASADLQAPVRIVVHTGDVKLYGSVDSAADKQMAETRARQVYGVFSVENHLLISSQCSHKLADKALQTPSPHR